ncbi:MAG: hypothetical protein HHJ14_02325 [Cellulomonas sp.]|nr:hypothetical protein [Cellulomonas sp.]
MANLVQKVALKKVWKLRQDEENDHSEQIAMLLSAVKLTPDDMEDWIYDNHRDFLEEDDELQDEPEPQDAPPVVRQQVPLPEGYNDIRDRGQLIASVHSALGETWQVESIEDEVATIFDGTPDLGDPTRPDVRCTAPGANAKDSSGREVSAIVDGMGRTMVMWDFLHGRIVTAGTPSWDRKFRDRVAEMLKIREPWLLDMSVCWTVSDATGLGEPTVITVRRGAPELDAERRREKWLSIAESLVPAPVGTTWWVDDETADERITLRRSEDPLGKIIDYPWDAPVSLTSIPFAMDAKRRPVTLGLLELNQLLGGSPGSGKSAGLATLLCGISRLENVALIGLDPKKVELAPWRSRFSRIARVEEDAVIVLEALIEEMERRYTWLEERDLKKIAYRQMSPTMPLIVVVIDELADLVSVGVTTQEKAADTARSAMIRRIIAKGRAAGIVVIAATQKPAGNVVPTELRDLIQLRVGYATTTSDMTDTILGAGMSKLGGLSHEIPAELKGVCYIVSETSRVPLRARTYYIPDEPAEEGAKSPVRLIAEGLAHLRIELPWMPTEEQSATMGADGFVVVGKPATCRFVPGPDAGHGEPTIVEIPTLTITLGDLGDLDDLDDLDVLDGVPGPDALSEGPMPAWATDFAAAQAAQQGGKSEAADPFAKFMH